MNSSSTTTGENPSEDPSHDNTSAPLSTTLPITSQTSHGHILSQHTDHIKSAKNVRTIAPAPAPTGILHPGSGANHNTSAVGMSATASGLLSQSFRTQKGTTESSHVGNIGSGLVVGPHPGPVSIPQSNLVQMTPVISTQTVAPSVIATSLPVKLIQQQPSKFPSHLPRGPVAASALSLTKTGPTMAAGSAILRPQAAAVQIPMSTAQVIPTLLQTNRPSLISNIKPGTSPIVRSATPSLGISMPTGKLAEQLRPNYQFHPGSVTPASNTGIQITLRNTGSESTAKPIITHTGHNLTKPVQLSQQQHPVIPQSKIIVSQSNNPMITSSLVNATKTAKITAQRAPPVQTLLPSSVTEVSRSEQTSHHTSSAMFFPNQHRGIVTTSSSVSVPVTISQSVHQTDSRHDRPNISAIPYESSVYNMYNHVPNYLMYHNVQNPGSLPQSAVRPSGINFLLSSPRTNLDQSVTVTNPVPNLSAPLQNHPMTMASSSTVRFNPIMIDQNRHTLPVASYSSSSASISSSLEKTGNYLGTSLSDSGIMSSLASVATVASSIYASTTGNQHHQPVSSSSSNPSASPRPTILRKRTSENVNSVKRSLTLMPDNHSPRPETSSSQPQSNTSSPKTPAGENSQSSTDTALSSNDAATPTQNSVPDIRVKQEPGEVLENGLAVLTSVIASQAPGSISCNSVEASPRKKPRKQLLHANEELKDNTSSDDEVECLTEIKKEKLPKFREEKTDFVDEDGVRWTTDRCKPNISLLNFYNITWKARNNHFQKATDVKQKEERRLTVNELSNQKGILQKSSGWKLYHMAAQLEDLVELEKELCDRVSKFQQIFEPKFSSNKLEEEYNIPYEMAQANIQRCQLLVDQLTEAKSAMLKVLDHKPKIQEIVNKHMSKRPIKKKERA
ncbi:hypothetical protein SNE40_000595 [Patella caerulea]|uniref:Histone deacetylase complex subunit SAP130 C-terminal domain-containing protein n=1 Tax=Patella caerulea TaxID=87958 RepID=A0AAN8Q789_PATCE